MPMRVTARCTPHTEVDLPARRHCHRRSRRSISVNSVVRYCRKTSAQALAAGCASVPRQWLTFHTTLLLATELCCSSNLSKGLYSRRRRGATSVVKLLLTACRSGGVLAFGHRFGYSGPDLIPQARIHSISNPQARSEGPCGMSIASLSL